MTNQINELIGYQNSADFWTFLRCCETKVCWGFLKFITFNPWRSSLVLELVRLIKKQPVRISKNADTLLMIDPLWLTLCSYFANALRFDTLLIQWNHTWSHLRLFVFFFCRIEEISNSYFFPKSTFINLSNDILLAMFSSKVAHIQFFSLRTTAKVRGNGLSARVFVPCFRSVWPNLAFASVWHFGSVWSALAFACVWPVSGLSDRFRHSRLWGLFRVCVINFGVCSLWLSL